MKKTLRNALALIFTAFTLALTACGETEVEVENETPKFNDLVERTTVTTVTAVAYNESVTESTTKIDSEAEIVTTEDSSSVAEVATTETEPVKSETAPVETTTVVEEPVSESEPATETKEYTNPEPPALKLDCLANSHEISIDELPAEDKEMFEQFMEENGLKGRFYDHIELTDDTPKCYFIPNEIITTLANPDIFEPISVLLLCPLDNLSDYCSPELYENFKNFGPKFMVIKNSTKEGFDLEKDLDCWFQITEYEYDFFNNIPVFIPYADV